MSGPILLLGLLLGARHAIEVDHVAAVAALSARSRSTREGATLAAVWGLGHAATLLALGGSLILAGLSLPKPLRRAFLVGGAHDGCPCARPRDASAKE